MIGGRRDGEGRGGEPVTMILCVNQAWSHCTHLNNICCSRENISQSKLKRFNYPELSQSKQLLTIRNNKIDSFESMKRRFWTFLQIKRNVRKQRLSSFYWSPFGTRHGQWYRDIESSQKTLPFFSRKDFNKKIFLIFVTNCVTPQKMWRKTFQPFTKPPSSNILHGFLYWLSWINEWYDDDGNAQSSLTMVTGDNIGAAHRVTIRGMWLQVTLSQCHTVTRRAGMYASMPVCHLSLCCEAGVFFNQIHENITHI